MTTGITTRGSTAELKPTSKWLHTEASNLALCWLTASRIHPVCLYGINGASGKIRTSRPLIRNQALYPNELQTRGY